MTVIGVSDASATATAVLPTPVGPTTTGVRCLVSGAAEAALKLFLGKLDHRRPSVDIVSRERGTKQPDDELPHLVDVEGLARFDGRAARVCRRKAFQTILPAAKPAAGQISDELLQAARGFE